MPGGMSRRTPMHTIRIRVGMDTRGPPPYIFPIKPRRRLPPSQRERPRKPEGGMRAVDIIRKKRDGHALSPDEIDAFVAGTTGQGGSRWPDYQLSALLMAVVLRGMDAAETAALTRAMVRSGAVLDWAGLPGVPVDK